MFGARFFHHAVVRGMLLIVASSIAAHAASAEPAEREPPDTFCLQRMPIPEVAPDGLRCTYFLDNVIEEQGALHTRGGFLQFGAADGHWMNIPDLYQLDVLPLKGCFYQVTTLNKSSKSICFRRLPFEGPEGRIEAPKDSKTDVGEFAFYLGPGGGGKLHGVSFQASYEATDKQEAAVKLSFRKQLLRQGKTYVLIKASVHILRLHDDIRIGDVDYKIVNIVPPDKELHVVGWFEISKKEME